MPNPNNCLRYWDLADHIRIDGPALQLLRTSGGWQSPQASAGTPKNTRELTR